MALVEHRVDGNDGNLGCYYALATWRVHTYLDSVTWRGHNSSNCEEAILRINSNGLMHYDTLVWAGGGSRQMFDNAWAWSVGVQTVARGPKNMAKGGSACSGGIGCCFCLCGGVDYWLDGWNADVRINSGTTQVGSSCQCLGCHSGDAIYNLPNNLRILPPTGLSVTFPTSIGNSLSASISKWSSNSNIGGVPTNLPNAKYWNWTVDLLDKNGNMLAHYADNRGSSKSVTLPTNAFYTASGLPGSSAAAGSRYYTKANMAYKLRVVVNNEFNQQQQSTSSTIYTKPPAPSVTITSCVYDPATKKCVLTFDWSKASDGGAYTEAVKYDVYDAAGKYYVTGGTLKTVTGGAAASGSGVTVTGLASGEQIFVKVYVAATSGTSTTTKSTYSPVANAAFLGFDWDELRRTVTVRAEAPGAANCRIQAGDAPNKYNLGNQLTSGEVGTIVLKDLPHGDGQALYLQAVPEASNGYQYINEIAKVTVPVPNPILGVLTPPCGSPEEQRYIVDIVEKKADCSVTPKWQVGDRVVVKDECPPDPVGGGVGIYNVSVIGKRTDGAGRGVFTLKGRFTPGTDITKVKLDRQTHMENEVKYALSIAGRDFEVTADTTQSNYTYAYAFGVFLVVGDHDAVGDGVNEIGFAYPNSNGVFVGSNNSFAPKPTFEYCYDVVDGALEPWSKYRQVTLSCFPVGASEPNEVPIIQEVNTCS